MGPSSETRATLWVILSASTLTVMAGAILGPVVPSIQSNLGVSESLAGLIITTHGALIVVFSPVAGMIVDRVGPRRPFVAGLVLYALGGGSGLLIDSFGPLLVSRAVLGIGVAFVYTGLTVLIYEIYEGVRMNRALGLRSSANSIGAVIWPLIGGALGTLTWQAPFGVYLVAFPLGILALFTVPEIEGIPSKDSHSTAGGLRGVISVFRRKPELIAVYALYFGANALLYSIIVFYPQLLATIEITSSFAISLYLATNGLAGGFSAAIYDRLLVRTRRISLIVVAFVLWIVAFFSATYANSAITAIPGVVGFGLGLGLVFPSSFSWIERLAPADRKGQFTSYLASAGYSGQFLSPVLFGLTLPWFGIRGVFGSAAVIAFISLVGLLAGLTRKEGGVPTDQI